MPRPPFPLEGLRPSLSKFLKLPIAISKNIPYLICMADTKTTPLWWEISFTCSDPDDFAAQCLALGAAGAHLSSATTVSCYLLADVENRDTFIEKSSACGAQLQSSTRVPERNWLESTPELWTPLSAGSLKIVPVQSDSAEPAPFGGLELKVIPGTGFGTGHHATTAMLLELMQDESICSKPRARIADIGTGSGILAIAAAKIFEAETIATDNDPLALENAAANVRLNQCETRVRLLLNENAELEGSFNLIVANIYAEVLCNLRAALERLMAPGGVLLLSGILSALAETVKASYRTHGWEVLQERQRNGWVSLALKHT